MPRGDAGGTQFRALYKTKRWQQIRAAQLAREPLCRMCAAAGRVTAATVCDHINGHPKDETEEQFLTGPFQSLCKHCHDSDAQRRDNGGEARTRFTAGGRVIW